MSAVLKARPESKLNFFFPGSRGEALLLLLGVSFPTLSPLGESEDTATATVGGCEDSLPSANIQCF